MLAPWARFELATLRLTAETAKNLSALSGVAYKNSGAIFPALAAPNPAPKLPSLFPRKVHAAQEVLEARVGAQVIELRFGFQPYHPLGALLVASFQAAKGLLFLAQGSVDPAHKIRRHISVL